MLFDVFSVNLASSIFSHGEITISSFNTTDEENQAGVVKLSDHKEFKDFMEHANTSEPGLLGVPLSEEEFPTGSKMSDDTARKLCPIEDFPKDFTGMDNDGHDLWSDHSPFDDVGGEEFGEEEFMVDTGMPVLLALNLWLSVAVVILNFFAFTLFWSVACIPV